MDEISLGALPHHQARELLAGTDAPVYLLVNPVEYHGPHLPLTNDFVLSDASMRDLHRRLKKRHPDWPLIVAPPIHLGVEPAPGTGSVAFSYPFIRRVVLKACQGLAEMGARKVILVTFHGNPLHNIALQDGVRWLNARGIRSFAPFNAVLQEMLNYTEGKFGAALESVKDESMRRIMSARLPLDFHAGFFETSLVLHYRPELVSPTYRDLPPCAEIPRDRFFGFLALLARLAGMKRVAAEIEFVANGVGWTRLRPYPGYTGWPHLANAESGARFAEKIMEIYEDAAERVLIGDEPAPEPILRWCLPITLNGRLTP